MPHNADNLETAPELPVGTLVENEADQLLGFTVLHAPDDSHHLGAWIALSDQEGVLGRGNHPPDERRTRLKAVRQRPGVNEPLSPFNSPSLSRDQLVARISGPDEIESTSIGRLPQVLNGRATRVAHARIGDVIEIGQQLVLLASSRPPTLPPATSNQIQPFGEVDEHGFVGESPAAWRLRREIAFMGPLSRHVLVVGPTGTGKEIVAAALHRLSRRGGALVSRNAATFPESLVDAELFGNLKGYPNPGTPERKGLIGTSDGGTLFLDEFAELAPEAQAKLLRVLDSGEYQTLGESRARRSNFRLIGATLRPEGMLREDLLARFDLRLRTPSLMERPEDLPFLVRHLLNEMTKSNPALHERFFGDRDGPSFGPSFMANLARSSFPTNVRGLRALLWRAIASADGSALAWPDDAPVAERSDRSAFVPSDEASHLSKVLEEHGGSIEKSWRALGLPSRFALMRLLRKHRVTVVRRSVRE